MNFTIGQILSKKYVTAMVAIGVTTILIVWWTRLNDPYVKDAEQFLRADATLRESLGTINKLTLVKTTTHFRESGIGSAKEPDRKRYKFIVKGEDGKADVTVIVQLSKNDKVGSIKIENINH
jgi:hypothetical protein